MESSIELRTDWLHKAGWGGTDTWDVPASEEGLIKPRFMALLKELRSKMPSSI